MPKGSGLTKPMKLSADLADIVGKKEASRAECIKQLWAYIKKNNLQDPENKQFFTPDKKMAKVIIYDNICTNCQTSKICLQGFVQIIPLHQFLRRRKP